MTNYVFFPSAFAHAGLDPCITTSGDHNFLNHHQELTRSTDEMDEDEDEVLDEEDEEIIEDDDTSSPHGRKLVNPSSANRQEDSDSDEVTSSQQPSARNCDGINTTSISSVSGGCNNTPTSSTTGDGTNPPMKKRKRRVLFSKAQTYELERR